MGFLTPDEMAAQPDDEHRAVWVYLDAHAQSYPDGCYVPPMKAGKESRREPQWAGLECVGHVDEGSGQANLLGVVASVGGDVSLVDGAECEDGPDRIAARLFSHKRRGTVYVVPGGGRAGLHLLFRRCAGRWVESGYTVSPSVTGTYVKGLTVRKAKHSWHIVDLAALTGMFDQEPEAILTAFAGPAFADATPAARASVAAGVFAQVVKEYFGVTARLTAARTAVAAASRHLPEGVWLWRPSVVATTLARIGGGFRGGYSYYPAYRGPGYKVDIRRAYTWALSQPLPLTSALGTCLDGQHEQPGMYVCSVRGPGYYPAYLAPFRGSEEGFSRTYWNGHRCTAVLCLSEVQGLRALGFRVDPGWGLVYGRTVSFAPLVAQIQRIIDQHGADSPEGLVAKAIGVSVYGKLAENPFGEYVTFSRERPTPDHLPFCDPGGEEVPDAWSHSRTAYRAHQHVDIAAEITALVRARLYDAMARLDESGVRVLAVDTDGMVVHQHPGGALPLDGRRVGDWRYCGYDPDVIIAGPRFAAWQGRAITAGTSQQSPDVVAIAYDKGVVSVEGKVMAPAWSPAPMLGAVRRTLRRVGRTVDDVPAEPRAH